MMLRIVKRLNELISKPENNFSKIAADLNTIEEIETSYNNIRVLENSEVRILSLNNNLSGYLNKQRSKKSLKSRIEFSKLPFLFNDSIDKVLIIGGGAYSIPKMLVDTFDVEVDVAEIDKKVENIGKKYFYLNEYDQINSHTVDGKSFLKEADKDYSLIVNDAFCRQGTPAHLKDMDFFKTVYSKTSEDGMFLMNIIDRHDSFTKRYSRIAGKLGEVFPHTEVFCTEKQGRSSFFIIGSKRPIDSEKLNQTSLEDLKTIKTDHTPSLIPRTVDNYLVETLVQLGILKERLVERFV